MATSAIIGPPQTLHTSQSRQGAWPRYLSFYVGLYAVAFALYALLGKGFAYAGYSPFFVGEGLLAGGLIALACSRNILSLVWTPLGACMLVFFAWQGSTATPHFSEYGVDTLRDAAVWGYAIFAWTIGAVSLRLRGFLRASLAAFDCFLPVFLIGAPISWLTMLYFGDTLPRWPGTTVSIPSMKSGEICVHLAGLLAFMFHVRRTIQPWWLMLLVADVVLAMKARGGLSAFLIAAALTFLLRPQLRRLALLLVTSMIILVAMATLDVRFTPPGSEREFSLDQLSESLYSVVGSSDVAQLENTKLWRLRWWGEIWDYTVRGPYFWTGKGYGINLADSDGFQVSARNEPLRSPHSSHLAFLARSGVPGFVLWLTLQATWATSIWRAYRKSRTFLRNEWTGLFAWLLVYWLAFMISAAFDVFLEGPMAGIPFWTIFGLGWGAHTLFYSQLARRPTSALADQS